MTIPLDDNATFLWTIILMGIAMPICLAGYAALRSHMARTRLERLRED
ncbi:MAG: hypothetical protein AAGG45_07900 [Pseudomonadota bacterium]